MLNFKLVVMEEGYEKSLLQLLSGRKGPAAYESTPHYIGHSGLSEKDLEPVKPETAEPAAMKTIPLESAIGEPQASRPSSRGTSSSGGPEPPKCAACPTAEEFIRFACSCGKRFEMPTKYAGKTGICPKCKLRVRIPEKG